MKIVADEAATRHIEEHGGRAWVWLERHPFPGGGYMDLQAATEVPGSSRATRRFKSARRPHRYLTVEADGFDVLFDHGRLEPPQELHLVLKRFPRTKLVAYWNGARFAGEDVPPPDEWGGEVPGRHGRA